MATTTPIHPETLVTLKINFEGKNGRYKLPLRDLGANTLPDRVSHSTREAYSLIHLSNFPESISNHNKDIIFEEMLMLMSATAQESPWFNLCYRCSLRTILRQCRELRSP
jgi:hypothetical protein